MALPIKAIKDCCVR